jgi:hypothetical protein
MKALLALPLLFACAAAAADDDAILRCRALSDTGARLSCYDAIPVAHGVTSAASPAPTPARASAPAGAAVAVAPVAPVAAVAAASTEQSFGMNVAKPAAPAPPAFIESTIDGDIDGWGPTTEFKLANGQVWRVIDGSDAVLPRMHAPQVRIARNLFGNMYLELPGTNNSPKVRRVR